MLPPGSVLITDDKGTMQEITSVPEAGNNIQHINGLLCPGFVNAHCHLELSHMLGQIPEKTGLTDFLLKIIFERSLKEDVILSSIEAAETAMLQNGIVAVGDICNTTNTLEQKKQNRIRYHNFIETAGFTDSAAQTRFEGSKQVFDKFALMGHGNSIVPHASYSVSPALFELINYFPGNRLLTIHNQEAAAENQLFQMKEGDFLTMYQKMNIDISDFEPTGKTSLQSWLPHLNKYRSLILVHDVCTNAGDIDFEKQHTDALLSTVNSKSSTHYCLCPNANLYITGQLPDVNLLTKKNCNIVLGTDSLASNHQLNILAEMKTLQQHFPALSLETLLQWATINGARALQMDSVLGSFEKGKQPGLVQVEQTNGHFLTPASSSKRIL